MKQTILDKKSLEIEKIEKKIIFAEQEFSNNKFELYSPFLQVPEGRLAIRVNGRTESQFTHSLDFIREILSEDAEIESVQAENHAQIDFRKEKLENIFPMNDINFQERMDALENRSILKRLNSNLDKLLILIKKINRIITQHW